MSESETAKFVRDFMRSFGLDTSNDFLVEIWMQSLSAYPIELLKQAAVSFANSSRRAFGNQIMPGALIEFLPSQLGHPKTEQAWNAIPKSERDGGWVTDQMITAYGRCQDSLSRGDHIAARMCFNESYGDLMRACETMRIPAKFWWSGPSGLSRDEHLQLKQQKTLEAVHAGWIPAKFGNALQLELQKESPLVAPQLTQLLDQAALKMITETTDQENQKQPKKMDLSALEKIREIREGLLAQIKSESELRRLETERQHRELQERIAANESRIAAYYEQQSRECELQF